MSALAQTWGPSDGHIWDTVSGSGFVGVRRVLFGRSSALAFQVVSSRRILVKAPAHARGTIDLRVVARAGTSALTARDRYTFGPPDVVQLSSHLGVAAGGTRIRVYASGDSKMSDITSVLFGTVPGRFPTRHEVGRYVDVTTPPHTLGIVHVRLIARYAASPVNVGDEFAYGVVPVVSGLTVHQGWTTGGGALTISGSGFATTLSIMFGSIRVYPRPGRTTTKMVVTVPPHAFGSVVVQVRTWWGTSASTAAAAYSYTVPTTRPWTQPTEVSSGGSRALSCADRTFCVDLDSYGAAHVFDGAAWSAPTSTGILPVTQHALDCVSQTFCIAVGQSQFAVYRGTWSRPAPAGFNAGQVSCVSANFCIGMNGYQTAIFNGATWSSPALSPVHAFEYGTVSCVHSTASRFCLIAGDHDMATYTDGGWSYTQVIGAMTSEVSCGSATRCVAINQNYTLLWDGQEWHEQDSLGSIGDSASCAADGSCMVIDMAGAHTLSSGTWTLSSADVPMGNVDCVTAAFCLAVDNSYSARSFVDGTWSGPTFAAPPQYDPRQVSCTAALTCGAIDAEGNVLTYNGSSWSAPATPPHAPNELVTFSSIDCLSATTCIVAGAARTSGGYDQHPVAYVFDGAWTNISLTVDLGVGITALACLSATSCVFAGGNGSVAFWDGSGWSPTSQPSSHVILSISCGDASDCVATDGFHNVFVYQGGAWTAISNDVVSGALSVSCLSATSCLIGSFYSGVFTYDGTTFTRATLPGSDQAIRSVDCAQQTFCVAATDKVIYSWNGTAWTTESSPTIAAVTVAGQPISSVACSGPTLCALAVDLP